jgi:hypothetical protein
MLANDPPPGTKVRFLREVRTARRSDIGKLVRPLQKYWVDRPDDEFEVDVGGVVLRVRRDDIEKAE